MRIALGIVTISDLGGLQRDCLALAEILRARGHEVEIFAARGPAPGSAPAVVRLLPTRALTNHGRDRAFARAFQSAVRGRFDIVVGFNKMPGLDVYYCADPCLAAKPASASARFSPRRAARLALEGACFDPASTTVSLMLSPTVMESYRKAWGAPDDRLRLLPPRIAAQRARPWLREPEARRERRTALGLGVGEVVWLWVALQPIVKGLDRVLGALPSRPEARLLIVGPSPENGKNQPYVRLAERLKASNRVEWLGLREDVPELMAAADLLVHPARLDVTGQVILEAIVNGLPVVASEVCGFAHHVRDAAAGIVLPEPFDQDALAAALASAADSRTREGWSRGALAYAGRHDFARGLESAAEIIERIARARSLR